jgi:hypothetical protein
MGNIEFEVAEVLAYDNTYQYIASGSDSTINELFALRVRSCSTYYNKKEFIVKPSNINLKQIPLIGEFVLICKTFNQQSNISIFREQWYYITTVDLHSSINENMLPGVSLGLPQDQIDATKPGYTFTRKSISPVQPYEGDFILEGRFGNSIRFGSTVDYAKGKYTVSGSWIGSNSGDPIIALSNGRNNKPNKQFVVENIVTDDASLYLTSTQSFPEFKLNNNLKIGESSSSYNKSQFLGTADRIILSAKSDIVALDSKKAIELLAPKINIGVGPEFEGILQSGPVVQLLTKIINVIQAGFKDSAGTIGVPLYNELASIETAQLLTKLTRNDIQITK